MEGTPRDLLLSVIKVLQHTLKCSNNDKAVSKMGGNHTARNPCETNNHLQIVGRPSYIGTGKIGVSWS